VLVTWYLYSYLYSYQVYLKHLWKIPVAENALSASTDVGGTVNKYEYIVSKQEPRFPVLSNNAISALIAFIRRLLTVDALGIVGAADKDDYCIETSL